MSSLGRAGTGRTLGRSELEESIPAEAVEEVRFELALKRWDRFQVAETGKEGVKAQSCQGRGVDGGEYIPCCQSTEGLKQGMV